jgi:hypothetical protein
MGDDKPIEALPTTELIEASSFGSDEARHHRRRTPASVKQQLLANLTRQLAGDPDDRAPAPGAPGSGTRSPYFFLSYAREPRSCDPGDLADVRRFFLSLCFFMSQLAPDIAADERSPSPGVVAGHLAGDPWVGTSHQSGALDALAACRIFVPLLAPGYVDDALCRSEWASFRRRDDVHRRHHPFALSAIVPVLWEPMPEPALRAWAADRQLVDATVGPEYAQRGIRALMRDGSPAYTKAAYRIARGIHDVAETLPRPSR